MILGINFLIKNLLFYIKTIIMFVQIKTFITITIDTIIACESHDEGHIFIIRY